MQRLRPGFAAIISFTCIKMCIFSDISRKRLVRLIPFKHRLNRLNAKLWVSDCLTFSIYDNNALNIQKSITLDSKKHKTNIDSRYAK